MYICYIYGLVESKMSTYSAVHSPCITILFGKTGPTETNKIYNGFYFASGPMVYGIAYSPLANKDDLKSMGFAGKTTLRCIWIQTTVSVPLFDVF